MKNKAPFLGSWNTSQTLQHHHPGTFMSFAIQNLMGFILPYLCQVSYSDQNLSTVCHCCYCGCKLFFLSFSRSLEPLYELYM